MPDKNFTVFEQPNGNVQRIPETVQVCPYNQLSDADWWEASCTLGDRPLAQHAQPETPVFVGIYKLVEVRKVECDVRDFPVPTT